MGTSKTTSVLIIIIIVILFFKSPKKGYFYNEIRKTLTLIGNVL